jgi:hypothetical protein
MLLYRNDSEREVVSHHFSGACHDRVGGTLVINPGGYHASDCCAAIFDSSKPDDWRGLWE